MSSWCVVTARLENMSYANLRTPCRSMRFRCKNAFSVVDLEHMADCEMPLFLPRI